MSEIEEKYLFSQSELATIFDVGQPSISKWKLTPINGKYSIFDAVARYKKSQDKRFSLEIERAKLAREQAAKTKIEKQLKKMELEEKKKILLPASEIVPAWQNLVGACRSRILEIPSRIQDFLECPTISEAQAELQKTLDRALDELSEFSLEEKSHDDI